MKLLSRETIILINEKTIQRHGGNFVPPENILNPSPLEYLLEAIGGEMFDKKLYPSITDKAAFYMFQIVNGHIFQDGNKRTGLGAALLFLKFNGKYINREKLEQVKNESGTLIPEKGNSVDEILENFTMEMASGKYGFDNCKLWFEKNIVTLK